MELIQVAEGDIEVYRYYSLNLRKTYFLFKYKEQTTYIYQKDMLINKMIIKGNFDNENDSLFLIKTIPASQLKLLVLLKPTITIEELLNEENRLFECPYSHQDT